jgi:hypothetical protein
MNSGAASGVPWLGRDGCGASSVTPGHNFVPESLDLLDIMEALDYLLACDVSLTVLETSWVICSGDAAETSRLRM